MIADRAPSRAVKWFGLAVKGRSAGRYPAVQLSDTWWWRRARGAAAAALPVPARFDRKSFELSHACSCSSMRCQVCEMSQRSLSLSTTDHLPSRLLIVVCSLASFDRQDHLPSRLLIVVCSLASFDRQGHPAAPHDVIERLRGRPVSGQMNLTTSPPLPGRPALAYPSASSHSSSTKSSNACKAR
jgi:hypothetical protein